MLEDFVKPNIIELKYLPTKVIYSYYDKEKTFKIESIFVFVGTNLPKNVKTILENFHKNKYNFNEKEKKQLQKYFGKNYMEELGINLLKRKKIIGGSSGNEKFNENEEINDKIKSTKRHNTYSNVELDEELNIESFDKDKNDISIIYQNQKDIDIKDYEEKNEIDTGLLEKKFAPIEFVFDYIHTNLNTFQIQYKIQKYIGVRTEYQSLLFIDKHKKRTHSLLHRIEYIQNKQEYYFNLLNLYNRESEIIENIPIDTLFQERYGRFIRIYDERNKLLNNYEGFSREIYLFSAVDFLDMISEDSPQLLSNDKQIKLYYGFFIKYFPLLTFSQVTKYSEYISKPFKYGYRFEKELKEIDDLSINIGGLSIDFMKKQFKVGGLNIVKIILESKLKNNLIGNKAIFNLGILFHMFKTDEIIPYVKYNDYDITNKILFRTNNKFEKENLEIIERWKLKERKKKNRIFNEIVFKIKKDPSKKNLIQTQDFVTVKLNMYGYFKYYFDWNYSNFIDFHQFKKIYEDVTNTLIKKINNVDNIAFIGYDKISHPKLQNVNINYLKMHFEIKGTQITNLSELQQWLVQKMPTIFKEKKTSVNAINFYFKLLTPNKQEKGNVHIFNEFFPPVVEKDNDNIGQKNYLIKPHYMSMPIENVVNEIVIEGNINPRITFMGSIHGMKSYVIVLNFILRAISSFLYERGNKHSKLLETKETNKGRKIERSKLRALQYHDDVLFNFKSATPYSRVCQTEKKQPNVYTPEEFKLTKHTNPNVIKDYKYIIDKGPEKFKSTENVLKFENKTKPGNFLYYTCSDKTYKYPGFLVRDSQDPNLKCLPCCKKNPSTHKDLEEKINNDPNFSLSNNIRQFLNCTKQNDLLERFLSKSRSDNDNFADIDNNTNNGRLPLSLDIKKAIYNENNEHYIKKFGKQIDYGRFGHMPSELIILSGNNPNSIQNYINIKINAFLMFGIIQSKWSFISAVYTALGANGILNGGEFLYPMLKKLFNDSKYNFATLENGLIKEKFENPKEFSEYLINSSKIDIKYLFDFVKKYNTIDNNINIIVFNAEMDSFLNVPNITLEIPNNNKYELLDLNKKSIIIIRKSDNYFYPSILINNSDGNNKIKSVFDSEDKIIKNIHKMLNSENIKKFSSLSQKNSTLIENSNNVFGIEDILTNCPKIRIDTQVITAKNIVYGLNCSIKNKKFFLPIQSTTIDKTLNYSKQKYPPPSIEIISYLIEKVKNLVPKRLMLDNAFSLHYVQMKNGLKFEIKKIHKNTYSTKPSFIPKLFYKLPTIVIDDVYEKEEIINQKIYKQSKSFLEDNDILNKLYEYKYEEEIYELIKMEIGNYIHSERNTKLRKIINDLFAKKNTKIEEILKLYKKYNQITVNDIEILKEIFDYPENERKLDNYYTYDFDLIIQNRLIELIEDPNEENLEKVKKILYDIMKNITNIGINNSSKQKKDDKKFVMNYIREICGKKHNHYTCENSAQCNWDNLTNKCKLNISKNDFIFYFDMLYHDFIENDYIRDQILYNTVSHIRKNLNNKNYNFSDEKISYISV